MHLRSPHAVSGTPWLRLLTLCAAASVTWAGGTGNNALLIVDPTNADALFFANYYRAARSIPVSNILYIAPGAFDFDEFAETNIVALQATVQQRQIADHVDFVIVMPSDAYYVDAPNLVFDVCSPVRRFSISAAYSFSFLAQEILSAGGNYSSLAVNQYASFFEGPIGFSAAAGWVQGVPTAPLFGQRIFLGALLGYTGARGNTREEIVDMIDRSVASDGAHPAGTFYFMHTDDPLRSPPRHGGFTLAELNIELDGGAAETLFADLPLGQNDCLGIMTGLANPGIENADMMLRPGTFADHLTSFAARFDTNSQEKVSRWIVKGASGSWGTVEEPCNWSSKFPHASLHVNYFRGLTLGEAAYRSVGALPFQGLLIGDPLTRPFAEIPTIVVSNAPTAPVSGNLSFTPVVTGGGIAEVRLLIDGVIRQTRPAGLPFTIDTTSLRDGYHDLCFEAVRNNAPKTSGRWIGSFMVENRDLRILLSATTQAGLTTDLFSFAVDASHPPRETRLLHNGRIVARSGLSSASLAVPGSILGAGPVEIHAEAYYAGGNAVRSAPIALQIEEAGVMSTAAAPIAISCTRSVRDVSVPMVVELPISFRGELGTVDYEIVTYPQRGALNDTREGPHVLYEPDPSGDCGLDSFQFRARHGAATSNLATIWIDYGLCVGDLNCDGMISVSDVGPFVIALVDAAEFHVEYPACNPLAGDFTKDGSITVEDISGMVSLLISN
ncbi:MAG: hypothetical protein AB7N71_07550 [Phycisphaerae bacterium]